MLLERQDDKLYGLKTDASKPSPGTKKGGAPKRKAAGVADARRQKILAEGEGEEQHEGIDKSNVKAKAGDSEAAGSKKVALSDSDEDFS